MSRSYKLNFDKTSLSPKTHPPYRSCVVPSSAVKSTEPVPPNSFGEATVLQPTRPPMTTDASDKMNACDAMSFEYFMNMAKGTRLVVRALPTYRIYLEDQEDI